MESTREHYLTLLSWTGANTYGLGDLLLREGSPEAVVHAPDPVLADLPRSTARVLHEARRHWPRRRNVGGYASSGPGETFLPIDDPRYPSSLRAIPDPPPWLFCRGDPALLSRPTIAMVGSRRASQAGLRIARSFAEALGAAGYNICSGLALGIDAAAHRGAIESGCTVAVLATGVDVVYPLRHEALAKAVLRSGCLLSELPRGTRSRKQQFPRRNRIISGLSLATIIVEAALPSGTLHTAASALEQGRDVYVLPWSVYHPQGAGCLRLLRDGAVPITGEEELSTLFPRVSDARESRTSGPGAAKDSDAGMLAKPKGTARRILELVGDELLSLESLQAELALDPGELMALVTELELGGWLQREEGNCFRAVGKPCHREATC